MYPTIACRCNRLSFARDNSNGKLTEQTQKKVLLNQNERRDPKTINPQISTHHLYHLIVSCCLLDRSDASLFRGNDVCRKKTH